VLPFVVNKDNETRACQSQNASTGTPVYARTYGRTGRKHNASAAYRRHNKQGDSRYQTPPSAQLLLPTSHFEYAPFCRLFLARKFTRESASERMFKIDRDTTMSLVCHTVWSRFKAVMVVQLIHTVPFRVSTRQLCQS